MPPEEVAREAGPAPRHRRRARDVSVRTGRFGVAHRHGERPALVSAALEASADLVEADVHLRDGVVEVRHADSVGALLVDGWRVRRRPAVPLTLEALATAVGDAAGLLVDLKGTDPRLGPAVAAAMRRAAPGRPYVVCARRWGALHAFAGDAQARVAPSVGTRRELALLRRELDRAQPWGLCVEHRLVARLPALPPAVALLAWTVGEPTRLPALAAAGVRGIVSDDLALLAQWRRGEGAGAAGTEAAPDGE